MGKGRQTLQATVMLKPVGVLQYIILCSGVCKYGRRKKTEYTMVLLTRIRSKKQLYFPFVIAVIV